MAMCKCGAVWGGLRTAHCGKCHETFSGISTFDEHRPGECRTPQECGMVVLRTSGSVEIWGRRSDDRWWTTLREDNDG